MQMLGARQVMFIVFKKNKSMIVFSGFDGMSCGRIALERTGIKVTKYFASEVNTYAIKVSKANYPDIIQLGDICNITGEQLGHIDLFIGGSPCQGFSLAGKQLAFDDPRSKLFFEFVRLYEECKKINPGIKFLLENVCMAEEHENVISKILDVNPILINSALLSAQNRERNYWTNINAKPVGLFGDMVPQIMQPKDKKILLPHILEENPNEKYFLSEKLKTYILDNQRFNKYTFIDGNKAMGLTTSYRKVGGGTYIKVDRKGNLKEDQQKASCFTAGGNSGGAHSDMDIIVTHNLQRRTFKGNGGTGHLLKADNKSYCLDTGNSQAIEYFEKDLIIRRLTPVEVERLQTVPDNYTNHVSDTRRYEMLGNGWTVDVIAHIFSYL